MPRIKLCIADDHMVVQDGIRAMAARTTDIEFCGAASDGNELVELLRQVEPDVLLLDLRLGSDSGIELCGVTHTLYPEIRIIIFTAFHDLESLRTSISAGAVGFVLKDVSTRGLPRILRHVYEHGSYYDSRLASELINASFGVDADASGRPALTEREMAILRLLSAGKVNREIARELSLSPHTIKFYISKMMKKLGASRRAELVKIAYDKRLL